MANYRQQKTLKQAQGQRRVWLVALIALVATLGYLRSRLWVIDLSYEYSSLQKELALLKDNNAKLRLEVGQLRAPNRVEKFARQKMGLKSRDEIARNVSVVLTEAER